MHSYVICMYICTVTRYNYVIHLYVYINKYVIYIILLVFYDYISINTYVCLVILGPVVDRLNESCRIGTTSVWV